MGSLLPTLFRRVAKHGSMKKRLEHELHLTSPPRRVPFPQRCLKMTKKGHSKTGSPGVHVMDGSPCLQGVKLSLRT